MILSRQQILDARPKVEAVDVPEWDGQVYLKPLSVGELIEFMNSKDELTPFEQFPLLVRLSATDQEGRRLFEPGDLEALKGLGFEPLRALGMAALKLNKLGAKDDEAIAKNS